MNTNFRPKTNLHRKSNKGQWVCTATRGSCVMSQLWGLVSSTRLMWSDGGWLETGVSKISKNAQSSALVMVVGLPQAKLHSVTCFDVWHFAHKVVGFGMMLLGSYWVIVVLDVGAGLGATPLQKWRHNKFIKQSLTGGNTFISLNLTVWAGWLWWNSVFIQRERSKVTFCANVFMSSWQRKWTSGEITILTLHFFHWGVVK